MGAPIRKNMEGKTVGIWLVLSHVERPKGTRGGPKWRCRCLKCGYERIATTSNLERGKNNTCKRCSPPRFVDLTGQIFGRLVVLGRDCSRKNGNGQGVFWECLCDCGNKVVTLGQRLKVGHTKSCGCIKVLPNDTVFWNKAISEYEGGARGRGLEWRLTREQAIAIMLGDCHYCGDPPRPHKKFTGGKWTGREIVMDRNGIDRIDSSSGYTVDNCVSACIHCNRGKSDGSYDDFIGRAARIYWRHASKRKLDGRNGVGNDHSQSVGG